MKSPQRNKASSQLFDKLGDSFMQLRKKLKNTARQFIPDEIGPEDKQPFRRDLYTSYQLNQHAIALAKRHKLRPKATAEQLLKRLAENESVLLEVFNELTGQVKISKRVSPAAEWLLDNFYLVEEQIYTAKKHLPKGYSMGLPQLSNTSSSGLPRIYDIAVEIISHSDGHVNIHVLRGFLKSYQSIQHLRIGELWALPIMLRLALLENLRRLSLQISKDSTQKNLAGTWADAMWKATETQPKDLVLVIADMARSNPPMETSFIAELTRRLQEKGSSMVLALNWIEQRLYEEGQTILQQVQLENQQQAATQVSISNTIGSLRFLGSTDWRSFVEGLSFIDNTLKQDDIYEALDFSTRDEYRHAVEKISKYSTLTEWEVSQEAINFAKQYKGESEKQKHIGYYLIGAGVPALEKKATVKYPFHLQWRRIAGKNPLLIYVGSIIILTLAFTFTFLWMAGLADPYYWLFYVAAVISFLAFSQLSLTIVNWFANVLSHPSLLPKMDFSKGIPDDHAVMVVIPTIISNAGTINHLAEDLEVRFLGNREENISFALLTDFKDAATPVEEGDEELVKFAIAKIKDLNKKYGFGQDEKFMLFHRPRMFNAKEKKWIGRERKRGKLGDLNTLILKGEETAFSTIVGDPVIYRNAKYIITLDTDTLLPKDCAYKLVATMAHPLNEAVYNPTKKRVTEGYSILQPRVSNSLPDEDSSFYARIHGNVPGTDPYTKAISDVYQDLFREGSFIGKGIYSIKSFEEALEHQLPDNRILSHDLLEGAYARAGLVTDIQLYEFYPTSYFADMQRRHRWIRGDWQIAAWSLPLVPGMDKRLHGNPLSLLSIWKIADNMRRSFVPVALLLMLLFGWCVSYMPDAWTGAVLLVFYLPGILNLFWQFIHKPLDVSFHQHVSFSFSGFKDYFFQQSISLIFLPYEALRNLNAILVTLWRVYISQRNLLKWNPSHNSNIPVSSLAYAFRKMWINPVLGLGILIYLFTSFIYAVFLAPIILFAWIAAPFLAWYMSKPATRQVSELGHFQVLYLRKLSRKIWAFFEKYVTEEGNWLPPDNHQEEPVVRTAHRTSPTNIGLYLLSILGAYDFGFINLSGFLEKTGNTLNTLMNMKKFRGHLYNWYDNISLQPLYPRYVSTVDSGNMAGHIITLRQGLLSLANQNLLRPNLFEGITDVLELLKESHNSGNILGKFIEDIRETYPSQMNDLPGLYHYLLGLEASFSRIQDELLIPINDDSQAWAEKADIQLREALESMEQYFPWVKLTPVPAKFGHLVPDLAEVPSVSQLTRIEELLLQKIVVAYQEDNTDEENTWLNNYRDAIALSARQAKEVLLRLTQLIQRCKVLSEKEWDFLYDKTQNLLSIGYNAEEHRKDNSYYDLLASEARLASFVAISQNKLPQQNWFSLGRQLTSIGNSPILLSWSGSMFEYLMPLLVMPSYENTLIGQTYKSVIQKQMDYGRKRGVPWGISESAYNMVDAQLNYQYKALGVPGIGFKRGLGEDLVIAPYATIMALMVNPEAAYDNLAEMRKEGFEGNLGFYEAIDYTTSRLQRRQPYQLIKSYMAHHQGMSLMSLHFLLKDKLMQDRFVQDSQIKSAMLLLQERIPRISTYYSPSVHASDVSIQSTGMEAMRVINTPNTPVPEVQLLSNGRYHVMVTNAGGGYSRWNHIALTRWREDATCDDWGSFCYIRDVDTNIAWSAAFQPMLAEGEHYEAVFSQGRAEYRRREHNLEVHTEIIVSPEDDIELKRIHITNRSRKQRNIELTSYAEVVLAEQNADIAHPAFSNLFVQTEIQNNRKAILCTRRPRSDSEKNPWMFHLVNARGKDLQEVEYETDRNKFIGRGNTIHRPAAMEPGARLSNTSGSVLDPVISIRARLVVESMETIIVDFINGIAETKEGCSLLVDKYQDRNIANRGLELSWTHSQVILRQLNASEAEAQLYNRLAAPLIYSNASTRTEPSVILKNNRGQSGLWAYAISGDLPIVLVQIEDSTNIDLVKQLVKAHAYWRLKGLVVDLVVFNEDPGGYRQELQDRLHSLVAPGVSANLKDQPGGIFIKSSDQVNNEDRILFQTVAHIVLSDREGTLEEQLNKRMNIKTSIPAFSPTKFYTSQQPVEEVSAQMPKTVQLYNGYGGFSENGNEYIIITRPGKPTPAPWINVLGNPQFGSIVSESGQSYTWVENAHSLRLTPWNNDPVTDLRGEAMYIRDEESGKFWSPVALPCVSQGSYVTHHGFGFSKFKHIEDGIQSEYTVFIDKEAPVKFMVLNIKNTSGRTRKLTLTGYVEWVLGDNRAKNLRHTITEIDSRSGAILARNAYNADFHDRVAFFDVDDLTRTFTTDRTEFIGRNGTLAHPESMERARLSGKTGAALDPCAALQVSITLEEEETKEIVFRLGAGKDYGDAQALIQKFEGREAALQSFEG
ncbi:MAG: glucoamylase family protein, partial [Ferruginibacter sp.]